MNISRLTDAELLQHLWANRDPITTTELETEVANRLQAAIDREAEVAPVVDFLDEQNIEAHELAGMLKLLEEFNAADIKSLRQKLERADKWYGIAVEAGDLFQRLQDLTQTTL